MDIFQAVIDRDLNRLLLNDKSRQLSNTINGRGDPLLVVAARNSTVEIGLTIIRHGADINKTGYNGYTPLIAAVDAQNDDFAILLLEQEGIDVNAQTSIGTTALRKAVSFNFYDINIIEMLLESGADPNIADADGYTPLDSSLINLGKFELLLKFGADINHRPLIDGPLLYRTVEEDNFQMFSRILRVPSLDVDLGHPISGTTPLMAATMAVTRNSLMTTVYLSLLLNADADPFMIDKSGLTALDYVIQKKPVSSKSKREILEQAQAIWLQYNAQASQNLTKKFIIARRLRLNQTLPQRELSDGIINLAEYDNLCMGLQSNLMKPGVIALAKSLHITTSGQTKTQLCQAIASKLIIK
jgi:ankyrin repeat protein